MTLPPPEFVWWPRKGYGFMAPAKRFDYDRAYFDRCAMQEQTDVGLNLAELRMQFVRRNRRPPLSICDVGVGAGLFTSLMQCSGFDVNPHAIQMLQKVGRWADLTRTNIHDTLCFWDSFEHIMSPEILVRQAARNVYISLPVFKSSEHAFGSKHFKPDEHLWYFTERGLLGWMGEQGFALVERNNDEERYGREGIGSFHFQRVDQADGGAVAGRGPELPPAS